MGDQRGFSLLELLVGVSIIGIMATFSSLVYKEYKHKAYSSAALAQASDIKKAIEAIMTDSTSSNLFDQDRVITIAVDGTVACESGCDDIILNDIFLGFSHDKGIRVIVNIFDNGNYEIYTGHCLTQDAAEENYLGWLLTDTSNSRATTFEADVTIAQCVALLRNGG